jgi:hypothetical protein
MKAELLDFKIERSDKSKMETISYIRMSYEQGNTEQVLSEAYKPICDAYTYKIYISLNIDDENIFNCIRKLSTNIKELYRNKYNFHYTRRSDKKDIKGRSIIDKNFDKFPVFDFSDALLISQKLDKLVTDKIQRLDIIIYSRNNERKCNKNDYYKYEEYIYDDYVLIINDIVIPHKYFFGRGPLVYGPDGNTYIYHTNKENENIILLTTIIELIFTSLDNTNMIKIYEMFEDYDNSLFPNIKYEGGNVIIKTLLNKLKNIMKILIKNGTIKYKFRYDGLLNFKKKPKIPITAGLTWNTYDDYYKNNGGKLLKRVSSKRKSVKRKSSKRSSKKKN